MIWERRYNGPANGADTPSGVAVDAEGNVFVTGFSFNGVTNDFYTAKYAAADGALLWERRYDGPAAGDDRPTDLAIGPSGNVMVFGSSVGADGTVDFYTVNYAGADGALIWETRYKGPAPGEGRPSSIKSDSEGNAIVTGASPGRTGAISNYLLDYYTAKYAAADGRLLWEKRYNGPGDSYDSPFALAIDQNDDVLVTGSSTTTNNISEAYTAKYSAADGSLLWERRSANATYHLVLDSHGNAIVAGSVWINNAGRIQAAKYAAADGTLIWQKDHGTRRVHSPTGIALLDNDDIIITGAAEGASHKDYDWYTVRYAGVDGEVQWQKSYQGQANAADVPVDLAVDGQGNVVVTGNSATLKYATATGELLWKKPGGNAVIFDAAGNVILTRDVFTQTDNLLNYDFLTEKYSPAGDLIWEHRYDGPAGHGDRSTAVAVDPNGNVIVTGKSNNGTSGSSSSYHADDFYTAKYAAADGQLIWEQRYNSPTNGHDSPQAMAVDSDGNVIVTGVSFANRTFGVNDLRDIYTAKYAATDGALLWDRRYNGPADRNDGPSGVAIDPSGNVVVAGYSYSPTNSDRYIAKYAADDGAIVWERRDSGPSNQASSASSVAVDDAGNVYATGNLAGDYYTAKYAGADGALLWAQRYDGPSRTNDWATRIALDGFGGVVVAGFSQDDFHTIKYSATDGAVLWEKRSRIPSKRMTYFADMALGPNGMIAVLGHFFVGEARTLADFDYATFVYREALPAISIEMTANGVRLQFNGPPGKPYRIERAPTVLGPWQTIAGPVVPASGVLEYVDERDPLSPAFYRVRTP